MISLTVGLVERSYKIHVARNLLSQADLLLQHIPLKRAAVVTNSTIAPLYLGNFQNALKSCGIDIVPIILPDGESFKNSATLNSIYDELLASRCERTTPLIALGGGVIGDLTGFAAATYLRGVPFIQVPTTLLAQVDSSVGGKTGINHPMGKNMIGAFYQPLVVLADIATLDTLPDRELRAGIAEVIKYGLIRDESFFIWLEQNIAKLVNRDPDSLQYAVAQSCRNKAEVVALDERESGIRAILNLGHTFGHAIETGMGYGVVLHGEAVAIGTIMAAELSARAGLLDELAVERIRNIFLRAGLPVSGPALGNDRYLQLMGLDKKVSAGKLRFVLLESIGRAVIRNDIPDSTLRLTLQACVNNG